MLSKFFRKSAQKMLIFSNKANFERGLIVLFFILLFSLVSCGYRWGSGEILERYSTVCIPYAEGDKDGLFTAALVKAATTRGSLRYTSYGADLTLKVCLLAPEDVNIGFIYAPKHDEKDKFTHITTANEARLTQKASVSLIDRRSATCVFGPFLVEAYLDYDFESDLSNVNDNSFSLGQFEMHNIAQDAAFPRLYTILSEKIVDYVNNSW